MQETEEINLEPYIVYHTNENNYTAYIPYKTFNKELLEYTRSCCCIANYLDLPDDRSDYNPSYTYSWSNKNCYEIGIIGKELYKIKDAIYLIQKKLEEHNCEVLLILL